MACVLKARINPQFHRPGNLKGVASLKKDMKLYPYNCRSKSPTSSTFSFNRLSNSNEGCPIHPNWVRWTKTMSNQTHRDSVRERLGKYKQSIVERGGWGWKRSEKGIYRIRWRRVAVARVHRTAASEFARQWWRRVAVTRGNRGSLGVGLYRKSMCSMWLSVEALIFFFSRVERRKWRVAVCAVYTYENSIARNLTINAKNQL